MATVSRGLVPIANATLMLCQGAAFKLAARPLGRWFSSSAFRAQELALEKIEQMPEFQMEGKLNREEFLVKHIQTYKDFVKNHNLQEGDQAKQIFDDFVNMKYNTYLIQMEEGDPTRMV